MRGFLQEGDLISVSAPCTPASMLMWRWEVGLRDTPMSPGASVQGSAAALLQVLRAGGLSSSWSRLSCQVIALGLLTNRGRSLS